MTFNEWIQNRWRPITAIVYLVICVFDFMVFPVLWSFFLYFTQAADTSIGWDPLTLKGAGMFHLSLVLFWASVHIQGGKRRSEDWIIMIQNMNLPREDLIHQ